MTRPVGAQGDAPHLRVVGPLEEHAGAASFPIVGVGASAGGLEAASDLLRHVPEDAGLAFVLVQHLDPSHESGLANLLSRVTTVPVCEAGDEMKVEVNHVYVIPPGKAMVLRGGKLHITPRATTPEPQRLIDQFLRSLAEDAAGRCVGVVLSGTGTDGTLGLEMIRAEGGVTFAQDATASHAGMPLSAVAAGCVDFVLPPRGIAAELVRLGSRPLASAGSDAAAEGRPDETDALQKLFSRLRASGGVDFSHYKQATVRRRIERRMVVNHATNLAGYVALVGSSPGEAKALYEDLLIHVTSFFRDPETFAALAEIVFPAIVDGRPSGKAIRVWVPGCSTGEEVYSLAMALLEYMGDRAAALPLKLFGTDVSEVVVAKARAGIYGAHIATDVSPERLRRFFVPGPGGGYQISKAVRDVCVFARQDATRDPPFSKLDLVSCRNVLIYLGQVLQERVLPVFHYALDEGGFLFLGRAEAVGSARSLFTTLDARRGIYVRNPVPTRLRLDPVDDRRDRSQGIRGTGAPAARGGTGTDMVREADRLVLARAPSGVVIDDSMRILQFRGDTGPYLSPAAGAPSHDLLKMAREGLLPDLRSAVAEARHADAPATRKGVRIQGVDGWRDIDLEVLPLRLSQAAVRCFLVQFEPASSPAARGRAARTSPGVRAPAGRPAARVAQLERELATTKDYLESIITEQQAAAEDVETANEEILSSNEELQSTNEELQTAKEELQATNEELLTVNEELQHRNRDATRLSDDLTNLLTSVSIPIVMLGRDLRIRRFTPAAGSLLNLIPTDTGRPITDIAPRLRIPDLEQLLAHVVSTLVPWEREVQHHDGRWHLLSIRPYRTLDDKIDGAVLSLSDIDAAKRSEQRLSAARDYAESIVASVREPLVVLDAELRVRTANAAFQEMFRPAPASKDGQPGRSIGDDPWNAPELRQKLAAVAQGGLPFEDLEITIDLAIVGRRTLLLNARRVSGTEAEDALVLLAIDDVTDRRRDRDERRQLERKVVDAQKLESLGILAGGIAHDFNNILTGILAHANLAEVDAPPASELKRHLGRIDENVRRAAELCSQMLAYSGRGRFVIAPCDLNALVADAIRLVELSVGPNAELRVTLAPKLPPVLADATQIRRVVMNLLVNASESMGQAGGHITIATGLLQADRAYLATTVLSPAIPEGAYAYVEVGDEGGGMSDETLGRIFDPFFTTKFTGRGLGLAAVLGIVRGHEGALKIESELGSGSTFRLLLPRVTSPDASEPAPTPARKPLEAGGAILVVDDEDGLRSIAGALLESIGFRIVEARSGFEAIAAFRGHENDFRLVLLDMTMPGMSGVDTYEQLRAIRPGVRVILMSGYSEEESTQRFAPEDLAGFLRKPFGRQDLIAKIEDALGQA